MENMARSEVGEQERQGSMNIRKREKRGGYCRRVTGEAGSD